MKIAVVGAAGLVGRHVTEAAVAAGHDVVALARTLPDGGRLDITDEPSRLLAAVNGADVVVLAAALPSVEGCERDPRGTAIVNVDAVGAFLARLDQGSAFIAFSSEYVFDGEVAEARMGRPIGSRYLETDARRALNVYGQQKIALEDLVTARRNGAVLRVSGVFGPEPSRKNFVLQLVDASGAGGRVAVANDQWLTPTYAVDLGAVVVEVAGLVASGAFAGILHAAGPEVLRRDDFARQVVEELGLRADVVDAKETSLLGLRARRPLQAGLDTSLLSRLTRAVIRSPREALRLLRDET